jgi:Bacterial regulatory helix-turn-helix protein, lysR family
MARQGGIRAPAASNAVLAWSSTRGEHRPGGARVLARGLGLAFQAVSLTHIHSFVAVAEEGHVGRAARRLHLTQPPLSRHILALEDELGTPLFERTPRGMRLLPAGEAFLHHARRILAEVDAAVHTVRGVVTSP